MVSFSSLLALAVAAAVGVAHAVEEVDMAWSLPVGAYYRPVGSTVVSGAVGATTPFRRSPCPGLNTLANHGYLPRDGKNITIDDALAVVKAQFNVDDALLALVKSVSPAQFDLNDLAAHDAPLEHDASLTRVDTAFGGDQSLFAANRTAELLLRGLDGAISLEDVAKARAASVAWSQTHNAAFSWAKMQQTLAHIESGLLLRLLGGNRSETAKTSYLASFLVAEMFPWGWTTPTTMITYADFMGTVAKLTAYAA